MWYYNDEPYTETPEDYQGFVYEVEELDTGRKTSAKRTFGNLKLSQRLRRVREEFVRVLKVIGEIIMAQAKRLYHWLKAKVKKDSSE